jgi:hypothetical protein
MISRLEHIRTPESPVASPAQATTPDRIEGIDGWLDVLTSMLTLPRSRRDAIREELAEHLHQRCRDLMIAGEPEADAVRRALEELGEARELAHRLRQAHRRPRRSLLMNLSMLGLGASAVLVATLTVGPDPAPIPVSMFEDPPITAETTFDLSGIDVSITRETTFLALIEDLRAKGLNVVVDWDTLIEADWGPERKLSVGATTLPLDVMLEAIVRPDEASYNRLDWRTHVERIEFSTQYAFDQRETVLMSYDVTPILEVGIVGEEDIASLLHKFVSPDHWEENGGDLARLQIVGERAFIEAPVRMQRRARWLLEELQAGQTGTHSIETTSGAR